MRDLLEISFSAAPAIADHLWQSTLFAATAGLLTLILRRHSAQARYWLWLSASLKFLIPFSLLVSLGRLLSRGHAPAASTGLYLTIEGISQPFTQRATPIDPSAVALATLPYHIHLLPLLLSVWLGGFLIVISLWTIRWFRIFAALRTSPPLQQGRETETLRRLERALGISRPIAVFLSRAALEPGIFGIVRPVLLWPEAISPHLDDSQLEAVLAHELCHVRRLDNLAAVTHMLVEALFWFHPLVWWLGARLIDERERACDEAVVRLGSARHVYAESILKICEFCLGSPLTCVAGVTGSDLKRRMVHIMNDRILHKLNFATKLLLCAIACAAITLPIFFGLLHPAASVAQSPSGTTPAYTSVSIKPSPSSGDQKFQVMVSDNADLTARKITLANLIQLAYHIQPSQIAGAPAWVSSEKFDIDARLDPAESAKLLGSSPDPRANMSQRMMHGPAGQSMLQILLADHFKLALHQQAEDQPVYELLVADGGSKLLPELGEMSGMYVGRGQVKGKGTPLELLTYQLSVRLGRTVVDKTGLKGNYIYSLRWTPDPAEDARLQATGGAMAGDPNSPEPSGPPLFTAIQEQLGLKLEPATDRVQVLVVDHVEEPSGN